MKRRKICSIVFRIRAMFTPIAISVRIAVCRFSLALWSRLFPGLMDNDRCIGFISDTEAEILEAVGDICPMEDDNSRIWASELLKHYSNFYPEVQFRLDWNDTTVNSFAGFFMGSGQRFVSLKGGLVRQATLGREGIAIMVAHELGHHYGGSPLSGTGLSCEGQADYYGVAVVMKIVWDEAEYSTIVSRGVPQLAAFFKVSDLVASPPGNAGCEHPAGACRIATFYAAAWGNEKPSCAC